MKVITRKLKLGHGFFVWLKGEQEQEGDLSFRVEEDGKIAAISLRTERNPQQPLFGPQNYYDSKQGVSYEIKLEEPEKFMAIHQHKSWWVRPCFPASFGEVPDKTQLLIMQKGTEYLCMVCVCGAEYRTDLAGNGECLTATMASNCIKKNRVEDISLVLAAGDNPYRCCEQAVKKALALTSSERMFRTERTYPEMFEYFGWCSWDAFYHKVNQEDLLKKMEELKEKGIPTRWVLIDDGWLDADYDNQVLSGLNAAPEKFPEGLGCCVKKIKEDYGVDKVGVWHAVMGYWNGIKEQSEADNALRSFARKLSDGRIVPEAEAGKAFRFYDTWHSYLKQQCGIDFIKVDGQSAISIFYEGEKEYGTASQAIQRGLNASAALHFENQIINCMGMASQDMWHRPSSAISRSSDDFVPDRPHGFREHAIQNVYNSLLQGQFYWGDWDMFWSDHEENWQNSMLRAVSGGPVYTSDKIGRTNPECILPLIKKNGRIIRCNHPGLPTLDCLLSDPRGKGKLLKIFNRFGNAYVIAAFHINGEQEECRSEIRITDIPGLKDADWFVYQYRAQAVSCLSGDGMLPVSLASDEAELFLLVPAGDFATFGILEKYIGPGFVEAVKHIEEKRTVVLLSEGGTLGFVSKKEPVQIKCGGKGNSFDKMQVDRSEAFFCRMVCKEEMENEGCLVEITFR